MVSNDEKRIIGLLIGHYRRKKHISRNELLSTSNDSLCSPKTLIRIENGHIPKRNQFYISLCQSLDVSYPFEEKLLYKLDNYRQKLVHAILEGSKGNMEILLEKIDEDFTHHILYVSERAWLYQSILTLLLYDQVPSQEKMDVFYCLKDVLLEEDRKLLFFLFMHPKIRKNVDRSLIHESLIYEHEPLFFDFHLSHIISVSSLLYSHHQLQKILNKKEELTDLQKILLFRRIAEIEASGNDIVLAYKTMKNCLCLLHRDICDPLRVSIYIDCALFAYQSNDTDACIHYLFEVVSINLSLLKEAWLLLLHVLEKSNQKELLMHYLFDMNLTDEQDERGKAVLSYFRLKYDTMDTHDADREKYICQKLKVLGEHKVYKKILLEDLMEIVAVTSHYKFIYRFMTK